MIAHVAQFESLPWRKMREAIKDCPDARATIEWFSQDRVPFYEMHDVRRFEGDISGKIFLFPKGYFSNQIETA